MPEVPADTKAPAPETPTANASSGLGTIGKIALIVAAVVAAIAILKQGIE
jgi:hypothetical protein